MTKIKMLIISVIILGNSIAPVFAANIAMDEVPNSNQTVLNQKAITLKEIDEKVKLQLEATQAEDNQQVHDYFENDEVIITSGNNVEVILNGREKFERLKEDITAAKEHIHLVYYIFNDDQLGQEIMDLLVEKAKSGVEVRVIYDGVGSRATDKEFWQALIEAGGKAKAFLNNKRGLLSFGVNYRNHRKIVVIDGKTAYLGGYNIGEEYIGNGWLGDWRDTHLRITGNAVLLLQARFINDWNNIVQTYQSIAYDEKYFPVADVSGTTKMQIVSSGPDEDYEKIKQGMLSMIKSAQKSIFIQTPYLVPDEELKQALTTAVESGVDVRIMIPCKADHLFVYHATEFHSKSLAEAGVKIYTYQKGFLHAKTLVVDGEAGTIGTANFDIRSLKVNFETNAFIYDKHIAEEMEKIFLTDMKECQEVTLEKYAKQSKEQRIKQLFSQFLSPIL